MGVHRERVCIYFIYRSERKKLTLFGRQYRTNDRFKGVNQITSNRAYLGGAIYVREVAPDWFEDSEGRAYKIPTLTLSDQTFFEANYAESVKALAKRFRK